MNWQHETTKIQSTVCILAKTFGNAKVTLVSEPTCTCSKSTMETSEQCVNSVQS